MSQALPDYMDGTDPFTVVNGARALDREAWLSGQITKEMYEATLSRADTDIFAERERYRLEEENARKEAIFQKIRELRDSLD